MSIKDGISIIRHKKAPVQVPELHAFTSMRCDKPMCFRAFGEFCPKPTHEIQYSMYIYFVKHIRTPVMLIDVLHRSCLCKVYGQYCIYLYFTTPHLLHEK